MQTHTYMHMNAHDQSMHMRDVSTQGKYRMNLSKMCRFNFQKIEKTQIKSIPATRQTLSVLQVSGFIALTST